MDGGRPSAVIFFALASLAIGSSVPSWNVRLAQEQGPNVCIVEEIPESKHRVWTECKYWKPREICGQKPILRYECCEGYKRVPDAAGCMGVKPLKNVLQTARDLGASKFVEYIEKSGLESEYTKPGSITLFAPSDEAMEDLKPDMKRLLERYQGDRRNPVITYHTVNGRINSQNFKADMMIDTAYIGHKVRLNKFSSKVETVNCINIIRKDHEAINGIVHIIDDVLNPTIVSPRNLADILFQDGRFTQMARLMEQSGRASYLRRSDLPVTILAPSDEAFQKLPKSVLSRITNDSYAKGVVIKNHIIPHILCLPAVLGKLKLRTESEEKITFDCDQKGVVVEGNKLDQKVMMARNGVLYMIDEVLIPKGAKSILQLIEDANVDIFNQLVKTTKTDEMFNDYLDYTLFAPSNKGMLSLGSERLQRLQRDKNEAKKFVLHHFIKGRRVYTNNLVNNEAIMSEDHEFPLRMHINRKSCGVDGSLIETADVEGIDGVLHVINKPLIPTELSWQEILEKNSSYSTFLKVINQISTENPESLDMEGFKTVFVPTNIAFERLPGQHLRKMMSDPKYRSRVIRGHITESMVTSDAIAPDLRYYIETEESEIEVHKEEDRIKVNGAETLECDLMSNNGIIHVVDTVFLPDDDVEIIDVK